MKQRLADYVADFLVAHGVTMCSPWLAAAQCI